MGKKYVLIARDFLWKHSKILFPVILVAVVAVIVMAVLSLGNVDEDKRLPEETVSTEETNETEAIDEDVPLIANTDNSISTLIYTYYNAMALGDSETLLAICDEISDKDMLRYTETAKYIDTYPFLEIYTKPGMEEGTTVAYVYYKVVFDGQEAEYPGYQAHYICTDDQGGLYLKRSDNSDAVNEYIIRVSSQADVVEFNNRITVEYNNLMESQPELLAYLSELDSLVSTAVGEGLAKLAAAQETEETAEETTEGEGTETAEGGEAAPEDVERYATATATVNVRSSDSQQADKLGKITAGEKIRVLEQRVNGWSKVLFQNQEGYIKSEYLQMAESAAGATVIGTVTATTNINIRVAASETAEKLGVLKGGDTVDLVATENGWCKIIYQGQIAYVKEEFVQ